VMILSSLSSPVKRVASNASTIFDSFIYRFRRFTPFLVPGVPQRRPLGDFH
jgi:hypothetical protein